MLSAEPNTGDDNTYRDLDYLGYHKNQILIVLLYIVLKKIITNTLLQGTWIDVVFGNHVLHAQPTD